MSSSQRHVSYGAANAAAAGVLTTTQPLNLKAAVKNATRSSFTFQNKEVLAVSRPSNNTNRGAMKPSTHTDVTVPRRTIQSNDQSSHTHTSTNTSDDGNDSGVFFTSQASSNQTVAAIENANKNTSTKKEKPACLRPNLSIWTHKAPPGFNPLASTGAASARPLSPPLISTRKSRFSRFFTANETVGDLGSPESPFFPDGLSGGLISAMSDIRIQQQQIGEDVKSYVTSHYASPRPAAGPPRATGTKRWNGGNAAHLQNIMESRPLTVSEKPADLLQMSITPVAHTEDTSLLCDPVLPVYRSSGASFTQPTRKTTPTGHDPRATPFFPQRTTTIESLEQVAEGHEEHRSLTVTRPGPAWGQVPNWRTKGRGKIGASQDVRPPASLPPGEARKLQGMWPRALVKTRGNMSRDMQSPSAGSLVPSASPRVSSPPSSSFSFSSPPPAWTSTSQSSTSALGAIGKRDNRRTFEPFRPMNAVLHPDAHKQPLSEEDIAFRVENGISLNYHGNHENPRNISAKIPDKENCAVWIKNLPASCTTSDLLKALMHHRPGRVWATHINAPDEPRHRHAAAKVVFYHPSEAKRLLNIARQPGIFVQDRRICAIYNKQRVAAQEYVYPTSRALEIRGDKAIVNEKFLRSLFESHFKFEDEDVEVLAEFESIRVIEWRFGSMRAQAGSAYKLLERMYPCVDIRYATDPCAQYLVMPPSSSL